VIYHAKKSDDMSEEHDQLSNVNDSGSCISSHLCDCSDFESLDDEIKQNEDADGEGEKRRQAQLKEQLYWYPASGEAIQHFRQIKGADWSKFRHYKVVRGLKLPTFAGDGTRKFEIEDLIKISQSQMRVFRCLRSNKTLSLSILEQIMQVYQEEMKCAPLDLLNRMLSCGPLFRNYWLSESQLNCMAVSLPYFIGIRYINLENCGMKDKQAGYILLACQGLPKLQRIHIGQNQIGRGFVQHLQHKSFQQKVEEFSIQNMLNSAAIIALTIDKLRTYKRLKHLDVSGNALSKESAEFLRQLTSTTAVLEHLNLSGCLQTYQPAKQVFIGLQSNTSLRYLNVSCNNLRHLDYEFGSSIGRLVQVHKKLVHLDIRCCKLVQEEIFFICHCVRSNQVLMAVHMGFNNVNKAGRIVARLILNARVKYPFRAEIQIHEHIRTQEDKNMLLILNSFVLSSMPSDNISSILGSQSTRKPMTSVQDVLLKLQDLTQAQSDPQAAEDQHVVALPNSSPINEVDRMKKQIRNQLAEKLDRIVKEGAVGADEKDGAEQLKRLQPGMQRRVYEEMLQGYFARGPERRTFDLIQTLDFYGKKFALASETPMTMEDFMKEMTLVESGQTSGFGLTSPRPDQQNQSGSAKKYQAKQGRLATKPVGTKTGQKAITMPGKQVALHQPNSNKQYKDLQLLQEASNRLLHHQPNQQKPLSANEAANGVQKTHGNSQRLQSTQK